MFTKEQIKQRINEIGLTPNDYILLMGGSMVMNDYRATTHDLDIAVSKEAFARLSAGHTIETAKWTHDNMFEVNDMEFFEKEHLNHIPSVEKDGIRIQHTESVIEWKRNGGREKDLKDIELIQSHTRP